ncbi:MAG: type IV pilin protein [Betaproteobacteria bacterium]
MQKQRGVTLIELLITVAIIGVLGAIAVPAYRDYVTRGKLTDAQSMLSGTRVRLEQYYQDNKSYPPACGGGATLPAFTMPTATNYFTFACAAGATAGQTYNLDATGIAATGTGGFQYRITEANARSTVAVPSGWSLPATNNCWATKKGGGC